MYGLTTIAVLHVALFATAGSEYQSSYNRAEAAGMPLLVLVGTEHCPSCRVMHEQTIPEMTRAGQLSDVIFVEVDADENPSLTRQIVRGDSVPQLVLYTQVGNLWRRTHLTGAQSASEIRSYLDREIARGREVAEQVANGKPVAKTTQWQDATNVIFSYSSGSS